MRLALVMVLVAGACSGATSSGPPEREESELEAPEDDPEPYRMELDLGDSSGLSGMTVDGDGHMWIVTERDVVLVVVGEHGVERRVRVEGVPEYLDVESMAWLGGHRFALGTELDEPARGHESELGAIFLIEVDGDGARVTGRLDIPVGLLAREPVIGAGIEGLCAAGGVLIAAIEEVEVAGGERWAPVAVYRSGIWSAYRLRLSSEHGKVSGLACRERHGRIEALAVERHFGISRLLNFELPAEAGDIVPHIDADITAFADRTNLNFEGAEWGDDGTIVLVVDNDYKGVTGPNELVLWRLKPDR